MRKCLAKVLEAYSGMVKVVEQEQTDVGTSDPWLVVPKSPRGDVGIRRPEGDVVPGAKNRAGWTDRQESRTFCQEQLPSQLSFMLTSLGFCAFGPYPASILLRLVLSRPGSPFAVAFQHQVLEHGVTWHDGSRAWALTSFLNLQLWGQC